MFSMYNGGSSMQQLLIMTCHAYLIHGYVMPNKQFLPSKVLCHLNTSAFLNYLVQHSDCMLINAGKKTYEKKMRPIWFTSAEITWVYFILRSIHHFILQHFSHYHTAACVLCQYRLSDINFIGRIPPSPMLLLVWYICKAPLTPLY